MATSRPPRTPGRPAVASAAAPAGLTLREPLRPGARGQGRLGYLLDAARIRPFGRRLLTGLSLVFFLASLGVFAWPLASDLYATQLVQRPLADQFESPELVERYTTRTIGTGDPLTRIVMPAIAIDTVVVEGTSPAALRAGAGHYPTTPLPGEAGNVAIAGHRSTFGKPFNRLDEVPVGSEIQLVTPLATHTYRVVAAPEGVTAPCENGACWITGPRDWEVVGPTATPMLTLTTCHPEGTARERLILRAELVATEARFADQEPLPATPVPVDAP